MFAGVVDRLIPLQTWLFPSQVLLELDDHCVTLLALHHRGPIPTVKWLERVPLPAGTCEQGIPVRTEALADFIGDLLVERGFTAARWRRCCPRWRPNGTWCSGLGLTGPRIPVAC